MARLREYSIFYIIYLSKCAVQEKWKYARRSEQFRPTLLHSTAYGTYGCLLRLAHVRSEIVNWSVQ